MVGFGLTEVVVRVLPDGRLSRRDAALYLGTSEKTLAMWATDGKGPRSVKVGGRRFYFKCDLDAFISGQNDHRVTQSAGRSTK